VKCTYRRFRSLAEYVAAYSASLGEVDFHEGLIFGPRGYVLATGVFVDTPGDLEVFDPDRPGGEYFYRHVQSAAAARDVSHEAIATPAYLTRLQRGLWWQLDCHADFPLLSETAWGRQQLDRAAAGVYSKSGFGAQTMPTADRDRCLINQDMGVRLEQLRDAIEWVQLRLQVYPLWNCAVRVPEAERRRLGSAYLVDVGIYGEPRAAGYRHVRDMRELQKSVPAPSLWGVSYLTWDEIAAVNPQRYERYERVRGTVNAAAAFLHLKDKVVWVDPEAPDAGKIPLWRLHRSFGPRWWLKPTVYLLLVAVYASKAIWRRPEIAR
jgi:hypothetical protein